MGRAAAGSAAPRASLRLGRRAEVYLAADHRQQHFAKQADMPFGVWVRLLAEQRLIEVHRHIAETEARTVDREVPMDAGSGTTSSATRLAGRQSTPSQSAIRHETGELLRTALDELEPMDSPRC